MNFVDDEDLVAVARWSKANRSDNRFADVINLCMRRRIDLLHVNRAAFRNFAARRAGVRVVSATGSRSRAGRLMAVKSFGKQPRGCCFANAPRSRKQIGVVQPLRVAVVGIGASAALVLSFAAPVHAQMRGWGNPDNILDLSLLKDRNFVAGLIASMAYGLPLFGTIALLPLLTQRLMGYPAMSAGMLHAMPHSTSPTVSATM